MPRPPISARDRILTAAESLFAQHGFRGVSLRQITVEARVNVAALNYHFFDKESLWRDLTTRRLRQINRRRLDLLSAAQSDPATGIVPLLAIVEALARPLLVPEADCGPHAVRLIGRLLSERNPGTEEILRHEFNPVMTRFGQALRRHSPGLPPRDFMWRFSFVVGALHHAAVTLPDMAAHTAGLCAAEDGETALANFTAMAAKALGPVGS